MNKKRAAAVFITLLCGLITQAFGQGQEPKFNSNSDDVAKIKRVLEDFRKGIIDKDGYAITKLILNSDVLFHHINNQQEIDGARKQNAQFNGVGPSQLDGFLQSLATSKNKLEEKFHNIEIHQDGDLGLATFNYDFLVDDKVTNSGVEHWILCKIDGQWKILSLVWTSYDVKN